MSLPEKLERWVHEKYARTMGYFWLPCPRCGRMFGGHEEPRGSFYEEAEWEKCEKGVGCSSSMTCSNCPGIYVRRIVEITQ
jgi:hypothetical protein